tara:strand:- start:1732 stop:2013 length:282 start_codon:yes stop_codon:yes gene_type:complete
MLKFNAQNIDELQEECMSRSNEISLATVKSIIFACENNLEEVNVGSAENININITCKRDSFIQSLEINIPRCLEMEEYELVIKAKDCIDKLNN